MASAAVTRAGSSILTTPATTSARAHRPKRVNMAIGPPRKPDPSTAKYPAVSIPSRENSKNRFTVVGAAVTPLGFIASLCYIPAVLNLWELLSHGKIQSGRFAQEPRRAIQRRCNSLSAAHLVRRSTHLVALLRTPKIRQLNSYANRSTTAQPASPAQNHDRLFAHRRRLGPDRSRQYPS